MEPYHRYLPRTGMIHFRCIVTVCLFRNNCVYKILSTLIAFYPRLLFASGELSFSYLFLDNAIIHHSQAVVDMIHTTEAMVIFWATLQS